LIVFGTAVTNTELFDRCATPGIRRAAEPDSVVLPHQTTGSLFRNYNVLLDSAATYADLEALVLVHQDVEIADSDFAAKVREALSDPDVAIVGCAGAVGVRSLAWWEGALTWAGLTHRYPEYGGGDFPAISWRPEAIPSYASPGEVDSIDGLVMVLSPWAVRELRFDESLGQLHGYDFDICMQARAAGKKVVTAPFRAIHYHSLQLVKEPETWIQTYMRLAEKWDGQVPDRGVTDPRRRALRAEAEAACAKAIMVSHQMRFHAIQRQLTRANQELDRSKRLLEATRQEVEAARQELPSTPTTSDEPAGTRAPSRTPTPAPPPGKVRAIDYVVEQLGVESFASLELAPPYGQYAFYTIDKPTVQRGALVDLRAKRPRDHLLSAIEQAAEFPGLRVLDGSFSDPDTVAELGQVDAILLFDVLLRLVDPDWDQVLRLYEPATSCFVISNPQWERGESTVRLIDSGPEEYLKAVPPWDSHTELVDHLGEWHDGEQRPYRDIIHAWQWGITDADLKAKIAELGFSLEREWNLGPPPETEGFVNKVFVFRRAGMPADDGPGSDDRGA
jgi:Glycosyltransferase like family